MADCGSLHAVVVVSGGGVTIDVIMFVIVVRQALYEIHQ